MSLIREIHQQKTVVRYALFALSAVIAISIVGFYWFTTAQQQMYFALHDDPQDRNDFLAQRSRSLPQPLLALGKGVNMLVASAWSLFGIDRSKGLDRPAERDAVYMLPLSK